MISDPLIALVAALTVTVIFMAGWFVFRRHSKHMLTFGNTVIMLIYSVLGLLFVRDLILNMQSCNLAENTDKVEAHFLPPYAFELMPVEGFNGQLEVHELKNAAYRDTADLQACVHRKARRIQRNRSLCRSFWGQTPLL
ncbi:MAG: hypothetical protein ACYDBQ_06140 [Thermoplasmatota archaeon]